MSEQPESTTQAALGLRTRPSPASNSLDRRDPLATYMADVQRYPLLTLEEERALAFKYYDEGDVLAAKRLVTANLRLVVKIAYDYRRAYRNILDLVQEGNIGLMQAVQKYDPYRGVKLSSYAAWWIRAYILRFVLANWRMVKIGTTQAQRKLFFNLQKEKAKLSAMGIEPTSAVLAKRLAVREEDVVSMDHRLASGELSLDAPVGGEGDDGRSGSKVDTLSAPGQSAESVLAESQIHDRVSEAIAAFGQTLAGKESEIFHLRLMAEEPLTLQELGGRFGVTRERVRQLEKRVMQRLKDALRTQFGDEAGLLSPSIEAQG